MKRASLSLSISFRLLSLSPRQHICTTYTQVAITEEGGNTEKKKKDYTIKEKIDRRNKEKRRPRALQTGRPTQHPAAVTHSHKQTGRRTHEGGAQLCNRTCVLNYRHTFSVREAEKTTTRANEKKQDMKQQRLPTHKHTSQINKWQQEHRSNECREAHTRQESQHASIVNIQQIKKEKRDE